MIYAMSDIHGQYRAYRAMLDLVQLSPADTLYIVGDVIDRGPDGIKILCEVMERDNIVLLRGNHEQMFLDVLYQREPPGYWLNEQGGKPTLKGYRALSGREQQTMRGFLEAAPLELHIQVEGLPYHLIHGRPSRDPVEKLLGRFRSSQIRRYPASEYIVFGHTSTIKYRNTQPMRILISDSGLIGIDCGCAIGKAPGRLGCLRLNDWREYYTPIP